MKKLIILFITMVLSAIGCRTEYYQPTDKFKTIDEKGVFRGAVKAEGFAPQWSGDKHLVQIKALNAGY